MSQRSAGVRVLGALGVLGMLLTGCANDDPGPDPIDAGAQTSAGFASRLAEFPITIAEVDDPIIQIAIADLDMAASLAGVTRPAGSTDPDQLREYVNALSGQFAEGPPVAALFPEAAQIQRLPRVAEFADEVGWSIADVSWFAEYQRPPDNFTVLGGDLDQSRLTGALGEAPDDGIWRLGGDDYHLDPAQTTAARPLGESLRLALADDRLLIARSTPPVAAALAGGATLADHPTLSALAAAMDTQGAYSGLLLAGALGQFQTELLTPEMRAQGQGGLPQPFIGIAVGSAYVDERPYAILSYAHETAEAATANAEALRTLLEGGVSMVTGEPWSERFGVDAIDVDGTAVVARLSLAEGVPGLIPYNVLIQRDNLASHL